MLRLLLLPWDRSTLSSICAIISPSLSVSISPIYSPLSHFLPPSPSLASPSLSFSPVFPSLCISTLFLTSPLSFPISLPLRLLFLSFYFSHHSLSSLARYLPSLFRFLLLHLLLSISLSLTSRLPHSLSGAPLYFASSPPIQNLTSTLSQYLYLCVYFFHLLYLFRSPFPSILPSISLIPLLCPSSPSPRGFKMLLNLQYLSSSYLTMKTSPLAVKMFYEAISRSHWSHVEDSRSRFVSRWRTASTLGVTESVHHAILTSPASPFTQRPLQDGLKNAVLLSFPENSGLSCA